MYKIVGADGKEYGPVTIAQLRQWLTEGRVNAQTRVLAGDADWKKLGELPEFALSAAQAQFQQPIRPLASQPMPGRAPQTNGFAVAGLILGMVSLLISCCCCGGLPFNLMGVIFSGIALAQINRQPELYNGKGVAVAGLVLSGLSLLLGAGIMILSGVLNWNEIAREMEKL